MGTGVTVLVLWMTNFAVSLSFPVLVAGIGISTTFFVFAVLSVGSLVFAVTRVPETNGRSLEQLEGDLRADGAR
jgi:major inositol transporter-like SP family MFS transporter